MLLTVVRVLYLGICSGVLATYVESVTSDKIPAPDIIRQHPVASFYVLLAITQFATLVDLLVPRKRIEVISAIYFGLLVGVLLAYAFVQAIIHVVPETSAFYTVAVICPVLMLPFICVSLILQTKDDFRFVIPYVEFARELKGTRPLIIDTSALIDGRIADVVETGIVESELIVPDFVLAAAQEIADSADKNRRLRGRRGLQVLERLKTSEHVDVRIHSDRGGERRAQNMDQRLVSLAQSLGAGVITSDFALNKVAGVLGVPVVNLNDLANALRPRYIPGEHLRIRVMKAGESNGQGVGYLDDGTMVVCENARDHIGEDLVVTVTSVLQKSEGRMIFGKPADTPHDGDS